MTDADTPEPAPEVRPSPELEELLRASGVDEEVIEDARAHGHLGLVAIERLVVTDPVVHDLDTVSARTGIQPELLRQIWRSLGFVDARPGDAIYTDADIALIEVINQIIQSRLVDEDLVIQVARVIGSSTSRMASAFVDAVESSAEPFIDQGDDDVPERFARIAPELISMLAGVNDYTWRRHVQGEVRSRMERDHAGADPTHRVVGFADLVGFTAMSQLIDAHDLAEVVHRFETIAYDTIGSVGGRVVKMIGDEVMFAVDDESLAADLALTLSDAYAGDDRLGDVRVGMAAGPVLTREADLFGPVVNLASRLVGVAYPGSVLVDEHIHTALADRDDLVWRPLGSRKLKDIGKVPIYVMRRATTDRATDSI